MKTEIGNIVQHIYNPMIIGEVVELYPTDDNLIPMVKILVRWCGGIYVEYYFAGDPHVMIVADNREEYEVRMEQIEEPCQEQLCGRK